MALDEIGVVEQVVEAHGHARDGLAAVVLDAAVDVARDGVVDGLLGVAEDVLGRVAAGEHAVDAEAGSQGDREAKTRSDVHGGRA